eukprot:10732241-Heterocapsa_arctica.AAC.1
MHGHDCSESTWTRPNRIKAPTMTHCDNLCTLIIRDSPAFWIQGTLYLALGHGQVTGDAYHPFYMA